MVNIKDVAKLANVSIATVSRYLNQSGYISKQSKEKIEKEIETLNYLLIKLPGHYLKDNLD